MVATKKTNTASGLDKALAELNNAGKIQISRGSDSPAQNLERLPTGIIRLDEATGGGIPRGRITEVFGKEACLNADTIISYHVRDPLGEIRNAKGGTVENLYYRFNKIPREGKGNYRRAVSEDSIFTAPSIDERGRIFHNRIVDVVDSGIQECFRVTTECGEMIETTLQHRFFTGDKWSRLENLSVSDVVYIHNNTPFRKESPMDKGRKEIFVKHHPHGRLKIVDRKYEYKRIKFAKAVLESHMNGLSLDDFRKRLNAGELDGLVFVDPSLHVHHIDGNHENDVPENLVAITPKEHNRHHANERIEELSFIAVPTIIKSIESIGMKRTYDVKMLSPYNNFVANRFIVHNSGKTTVALHTVAKAQQAGLNVAYLDMEQALDPTYMSALGVNWDSLILSQPDYAEQVFEALEKLAATNEVALIVVDSVAAMSPRQEAEGDYGDANVGSIARVMSQGLRKLNPHLAPSKTAILFINQLRANIGAYSPQGPPPDITTGGKALKFYASLRIEINRIGAIKAGDSIIGAQTKAKVIKNKTFAPYKEATFDIIYGRGVSRGASILDKAVEVGAIKKSGAWYTDTEGESLGQGKPAAIDLLDTDDVLYARILSEVEGK